MSRIAHESIQLPGNDPGEAAMARRFVLQIAAGRVSERVLDDMQAVASELVQLVIRPAAFEPIQIAVAPGPRRSSITIRCVTGRVDRLPRPSRWPRGRLADDQLGLRIIHGLSNGVRLRRQGRTMSITAFFSDRPSRLRDWWRRFGP